MKNIKLKDDDDILKSIITSIQHNKKTKEVKLYIPGKKLIVETKQYKGKKYLDIREFYLDLKTNTMKPSKKGYVINESIVREVIMFIVKYNKSIIDYFN